MTELCVPAKAVEVNDEGGGAVAPEKGDTVTIEITGKVTRAENGRVYIEATEANGQPIGKMEGRPEEKTPEDTQEDMDTAMAQARSESGEEEGYL